MPQVSDPVEVAMPQDQELRKKMSLYQTEVIMPMQAQWAQNSAPRVEDIPLKSEEPPPGYQPNLNSAEQHPKPVALYLHHKQA